MDHRQHGARVVSGDSLLFKKNSEIGGRQVESFVLYYTKVYPYDFTKGGVFL
jgi:hypothetical protein